MPSVKTLRPRIVFDDGQPHCNGSMLSSPSDDFSYECAPDASAPGVRRYPHGDQLNVTFVIGSVTAHLTHAVTALECNDV
jgi:hypothetical protein